MSPQKNFNELHINLDQLIDYLENKLPPAQAAEIEQIVKARPLYAYTLEELEHALKNGELDRERLGDLQKIFDQQILHISKEHVESEKGSVFGQRFLDFSRIRNSLNLFFRSLYAKPQWALAILLLFVIPVILFFAFRPPLEVRMANDYLAEAYPSTHLRSGTHSEEDFKSQAFQNYDQENFEAAIPLFKKALVQNNVADAVELNMYLGISLMQADQAQAAIPYLEHVIDQGESEHYLNGAAEWYLSLAYLAQSDKGKALPILKRVSENEHSIYAAKATKILGML